MDIDDDRKMDGVWMQIDMLVHKSEGNAHFSKVMSMIRELMQEAEDNVCQVTMEVQPVGWPQSDPAEVRLKEAEPCEAVTAIDSLSGEYEFVEEYISGEWK